MVLLAPRGVSVGLREALDLCLENCVPRATYKDSLTANSTISPAHQTSYTPGIMARFAQLLALAATISLVSAAPAATGVKQYAPKVIPAVWKKLGAAPTEKPITFTVVFGARDAQGLEERMTDIALSHGDWLTQDEVSTYIAPSADAKAAVEAALKSIGATDFSYSAIGDKLTVTTTVDQAAEVCLFTAHSFFISLTHFILRHVQFFAAEFIEYTQDKATDTAYKTHEYTIPASISEHIVDVYPFATFASFKHHSHVTKLNAEERAELEAMKKRSTTGCSVLSVTSTCIRNLYGYSTYQPTTSTGNPRLGM